MHPRIKELVEALDSRRAELTRAVNDLPTSARNRRPLEDRWSVAEVLEHLALGPLNGYQWFLFLAAHEARHTAQIREIMTSTV